MVVLTEKEKDKKLKEIKNILLTKNIKVLTSKFLKFRSKIDCECLNCCFKWLANPSDILYKKSGCPNCAGNLPVNFEKIKQILSNKNIKVLNNDCKKSSDRLEYLCEICEWKWMAKINNLIHRKSGCPKCAGNIPESFDEIKKSLYNRNIKVLSETYINNKSKINCECVVCFYLWQATTKSLNLRKTGCPKCAGIIPKPFDEIKSIAHSKNVAILSQNYKNNRTKLNCECLICKIKFKILPHVIINGNGGCPNCFSGYGERATKFIFETILGYEFIKLRPAWLRFKTRNLELDGYCAELNIAFEHNGMQHYKFIPRFHESKNDFINQQERDLFKKEICKKLNIILIEIDNSNCYGFDKLFEIVKLEFIKNKIKFKDVDIKETMLLFNNFNEKLILSKIKDLRDKNSIYLDFA